MTSQDYTLTRQQRESNAEAHYYEARRKYAALGKNADDISTWWEWREHHGSRYAHHDYPKPYCGEYFGHFIRSVMGSRFVDLKPWLHKEFVGDEVDRDYLEGLLDYAEQTHGLHQDGAMLILRNGDEVSYDPLPLGQVHPHPDGVASSNVIWGGEEFRRRAIIIREWCRSKADSETSTKAQHILLHRRQLEALAHEQEMAEKYSINDESGRNIAAWSGEKEVIGADGKPHLLFYQDKPKPHSSLYIGYFLNYIQQQDLEDITPWLNREFNNDAVDKKYVNSLLIELETLGMDVEGTTIVQQGEELVSYPPNPVGEAYSYAENFRRIVHDNISYGGIKFVRRAQTIREWCRLNGGDTTSTLAIESSIAASSDSTPDRSKPDKKSKPDPRDASETLETYLSEFTTAGCDDLAASVGLYPPASSRRKPTVLNYHPVQGAKTMLYAIADALEVNDKLVPGQKIAFIRALGRRLGFPVEKPAQNSGTDSYKNAFKQAKARLEEFDKDGMKRQNAAL